LYHHQLITWSEERNAFQVRVLRAVNLQSFELHSQVFKRAEIAKRGLWAF
jgi:hypothetical protein